MKMFNWRSLTAGLLFILAFVALPSANAHSDLISSNPATEANLEQIPESFSLTFNEELISIEGKSVNTLTLQGNDGANYDLPTPTVVGAVLSAKTGSAEYPAGDYLLKYRVVSADGHPISGEISFSTQTLTTIGSAPVDAEATPYVAKMEDSSPENALYIVVGLLLALASAILVKKRMGNGSRN
jgi:methionine-rich copper-binding protein CopC